MRFISIFTHEPNERPPTEAEMANMGKLIEDGMRTGWLIATEGVEVDFTEEGIRAIARIAAEVNGQVENIGARRLSTVLEKLLEDVSFEAEERMKARGLSPAERRRLPRLRGSHRLGGCSRRSRPARSTSPAPVSSSCR